jgi:hypothetical protein
MAAFCPHCGLALNSLPPPVPQGQLAGRSARSGLVMLIWILLGVIGLAAYVYWRWESDEAMPPLPPERPHVQIHQYYR